MSLPKSSLSVTSIGATIRFELQGIAATIGAIGEGAARFDEIGAGVEALAELGICAIGSKTLVVGVGLFTAGFGALAFLPKLGFSLIFHWDMILKQQK